MKIGLFLEDLGHQLLVETLTKRILGDGNDLVIKVFNSTGGDSLGSFYRFLKQYSKLGPEHSHDLIVVASDADKGGLPKRRKELKDRIAKSGYPGEICFAIPNPNIERWYLADPRALAAAAVIPTPAEEPVFSKRLGFDYYKKKLRENLNAGGVEPLNGGAEFGGVIALNMDVEEVLNKTNVDQGFKEFVNCLKNFLISFSRSRAS